jgi:hypothetical protein
MKAISKPEMKLHGYSDRRIAELTEAKRKSPLAKASDLETIYAEVKARREEALALIKRDGLVLVQDKFTATGKYYQIRIPHPALAIARGAELELIALAKLLGEETDPREMTTEELLAQTDKLLEQRSN